MAGEDTTTRRAELLAALHDIEGADSKNDLIVAIDRALAVPAPMGDPDTIESAARAYGKAADHCRHEVEAPVEQVSDKELKQSWEGMASLTAQGVIKAAARTAQQMSEAFDVGRKVLHRLADNVDKAQKKDKPASEALIRARTLLGGEDGFFDDMVEKDAEEAEKERVRGIAKVGAAERREAAQIADDAARAAARDLNKLAAEAGAGKMTGKGLSAVDKMMLAEASTLGENNSDRKYNEILTANDLERSSARLNRMSPAERAEFQRMLDEADSPEQQAYLLKALAAGHGMKTLQDFNEDIDGKSEAWLQRHLDPVVAETDSNGKFGTHEQSNVFQGKEWAQGGDGNEGSCVASSTVHARAMVDPVYALELTGGPDGNEESGEAFQRRLIDEQHRVHEDGDGVNSGLFGTGPPEGMDDEGWSEVADNELNSPTGADYERQDLGSANARRGALPEIEQAVAEGRPVPIKTVGPDGAHALVITAQEGSMLQVHNPWGFTTWVSEDDFVDGKLGGATRDRLPEATGVHIPR
ncbi:WXG100 family type VII secretion target [Streptomyces sp. LHD-70]|uniref:WXG100 family type VII secretion target n=1 Tax=Streptomyces sp. LHD-70 TaxID=3072140 RepID=UPI00280EE3A3|nr:WXG100 family type VII secretion target [Streptomyces sp. LHD-70]MDQ8702013.1 WXG100 family type VII secretion target [Streptomyces sp. LHD-70]